MIKTVETNVCYGQPFIRPFVSYRWAPTPAIPRGFLFCVRMLQTLIRNCLFNIQSNTDKMSFKAKSSACFLLLQVKQNFFL